MQQPARVAAELATLTPTSALFTELSEKGIEMAQAYTSTVVAATQIALGVVSGAALAAICVALRSGLWPFAITAFLIIVATGVYLSTVTLTVTAGNVTLGQGRGEHEPRSVNAGEISERSCAELTWAQCFGVGMPTAWRTTRLSVRPGPTLCLSLRDGELIRISTPDPAAALRALDGVSTGS